MNKPVKCSSCGESYTLDLIKYGGKKIKCKKCQAIMAVPTVAEAQDEFEVVEDAPPTGAPSPGAAPPAATSLPPAGLALPSAAPMPAVPTNAPPLQRHRLASQRGAVNIALLQRGESSRSEIREAFLAVHGTEAQRDQPLLQLRQQLASSQASLAQPLEKLEWLKDVLARALASDPKEVGSNLTMTANAFKAWWGTKQQLSKEDDEEAYNYALSIVGQPVTAQPAQITQEISSDNWFLTRNGQQYGPYSDGHLKQFAEAGQLTGTDLLWKEGLSGWKPASELKPALFPSKGAGLLNFFAKHKNAAEKMAQAAEKKTQDERSVKINTIKAAIGTFAARNQQAQADEADRQRKLDQQISALLQSHKARFGQAQASISAGNFSEATVILQEMLKAAPVALLGQILVALSQCTYLAGNASNAARHIQDAICFGASAPVDMDEGYNDLWAKASAGLPRA